ncbi:MAG: NADH-quinone oxidoreductase subunit D [Thermoproteota archaeon]|jgi:NADH-quinone oxidoreductase subunit D
MVSDQKIGNTFGIDNRVFNSKIVEKEGNRLVLNVGPQHPGSGHFRLVVTIDGDTIVDIKPDPGYVHRGAEKMAEHRTYIQNIPHLERPVIIDSSNILFSYVLACEQILDITPPERGEYIRILMSELNRIISHTYWLSIYGIFLGHSTMFMWPMGDRELFIDLAQSIGGTRVTFSYFIPGGVRNDIPDDFKEKALKTFSYFDKRLVEYEKIFFNNPLVLQRTKGIGILKKQDAINLGITGPNLRASGVNSDTRKDEPYSKYDTIDFDIPVLKEGDCHSRAKIHLEEMRQSLNIMRQVLDIIPEGPVKHIFRGQMKGEPGEAFSRTEAARGTMFYHIISDGEINPYRVKISVPSFRNLIAMKHLLIGKHIADMPPIYWGLDYWPVEADK